MYTLARTSARGSAPVSQVNGAFSQTKVGPKVLYLDDQNFDQDKPQNGETFCKSANYCIRINHMFIHRLTSTASRLPISFFPRPSCHHATSRIVQSYTKSTGLAVRSTHCSYFPPRHFHVSTIGIPIKLLAHLH